MLTVAPVRAPNVVDVPSDVKTFPLLLSWNAGVVLVAKVPVAKSAAVSHAESLKASPVAQGISIGDVSDVNVGPSKFEPTGLPA